MIELIHKKVITIKINLINLMIQQVHFLVVILEWAMDLKVQEIYQEYKHLGVKIKNLLMLPNINLSIFKYKAKILKIWVYNK